MSATSSTPEAASAPIGWTLEEGKRLSESVLWTLQRNFYDQRGLGAWESGTVPSYVTSNPYIASAYAEVLLAFLRDGVNATQCGQTVAAAIDPTQPVYVIELAAGHGRFSFLLLRRLLAMLAASSVKGLKLKYVMTDFTANNLRSWQAQPLFQPFVEAGVLEFGLLDLQGDAGILLSSSGQVLSPEDIKNPLIVLGNYIFDTIPQDVFRIEQGLLQEVLLTTRHSQPAAPDLSQPEVMSQFALSYHHKTIDPQTYYPEPYLNQLLLTYQARLSDTTVAIPTVALRALQRLLVLSGQRLLLLSSDKGYTHEDELFFLSTQHIQFHGSLSMMVNYHAIGQCLGGVMAATEQRNINLKTALFLVGGDANTFADTLLCFQEQVDRFGPYDFYTLAGQTRHHTETASIEQIIALFRLSSYDPNVVFDYGKELLEQTTQVSDGVRHELVKCLTRCWENFFPLGRDLPFEIARILLALRRPREAVLFNQHSMRLFGEHPVTLSNMGICHFYAEDFTEALRCFDRAMEINAAYGLPKAWRARVLAELGRK